VVGDEEEKHERMGVDYSGHEETCGGETSVTVIVYTHVCTCRTYQIVHFKCVNYKTIKTFLK
jgi:hypothetical protein